MHKAYSFLLVILFSVFVSPVTSVSAQVGTTPVPVATATDREAVIRGLLEQIALLKAQLSKFSAPSTVLASLEVNRPLKRGMSGADVRKLQSFLAQYPEFYPEGTITGYYGALTEGAVKRFQQYYGIVKSGSPATTGFGRVGPKTLTQMRLTVSPGGSRAIGVSGSVAPVNPSANSFSLPSSVASTTLGASTTPTVPVVYGGGGGGGGGGGSTPVSTPDTTAPTISFSVPIASSTISGTSTLTANVSDAVGVSGVTAWIDATVLGSEDTVAPYTLDWNTRVYADGYHTLSIVARDVAGNRATSTIGVMIANATGTPTLTLTKYNSYANQTSAGMQSAYKLGDYRLTTDGYDYNLGVLGVALSSTALSLGTLANIYLIYGAVPTAVAPTGSSSILFVESATLPKNTTIPIAIYADIPSSYIVGNIETALVVSATVVGSSTITTSNTAVGQVISLGLGTLVATLDASTPVSGLVTASTTVKVASFRFQTANSAFTIKSLTATTTTLGATALQSITWKDGSTVLAVVPFVGASSSVEHLSISIPANTSKVLDAYADIGAVDTPGSATTSTNIQIALTDFSYNATNLATTSTTTVGLIGNPVYAVKSKPTLSLVALPSTVLSDGLKTIAKFRIDADANGPISWRKIALSVATSGVAFDQAELYDAADLGTPLASSMLSSNMLTFTPGAEVVSAGTTKTYQVIANVSGSSGGDTLTTRIMGTATEWSAPKSATAIEAETTSLVWSDQSVLGHSSTTPDWMNDYLIRNLPLEAQTLSL